MHYTLLLLALPLPSTTHWDFNLTPQHARLHVNSHPSLRQRCQDDPDCPYKETLSTKDCWGYETGCHFDDSYSKDKINCSGKATRWPRAQTHRDQVETMWSQGDFGFIHDRLKDMKPICDSESKEGSRLWCSDHLRYCYAHNIFFHFNSLKASASTDKYREVIQEGEVGGHCEKLDAATLKARSDHKSPLQSWAAELMHFQSLPDFRLDDDHCDLIYTKPTIVFKLDAAVSMYHHFCDFVNLYASQHINGSFEEDVNIVLWDTSAHWFTDNMFGVTWEAFTFNPLIQLHQLEGKKVCFRSVMMPLLARQRFGFYYNMPVIDVCQGTGFFQAFPHHILHRLHVEQEGPLPAKVRVTILSRSTKYRKMLNEEELVNAVKTLRNVEVRRIDYNYRMSFLHQLQRTHNTDVFVGIHGSGLTHLLFLPDWAAVFETYNCGDPNCYLDLARLRGVRYRTWEKEKKMRAEDEGHHPTLGAHQKFTNYQLDVEEFVRVVGELVEGVEADPRFIAARQARHPKDEL